MTRDDATAVMAAILMAKSDPIGATACLVGLANADATLDTAKRIAASMPANIEAYNARPDVIAARKQVAKEEAAEAARQQACRDEREAHARQNPVLSAKQQKAKADAEWEAIRRDRVARVDEQIRLQREAEAVLAPNS